MIKFLIPAVVMFVFVAAVQSLSPQPPAAADSPLITEVVQAETGPGFFPAPKDDNGCQCGDFTALENRVAALETKVASYGQSRSVASYGSVGASSAGVRVSQPTTTSGLPYGSVVVSERVVSSSLRTPNYQSGQPVRNVVRGVAVGVRNTACRVVNGVRICN